MAEEDVNVQVEALHNEAFEEGRWFDPDFVLAQTGSLAYPSVCPNHDFATDTLSKWRRNHLKRKRNRFNRRFTRRWGEKPTVFKDEQGRRCNKAFEIGSCHDLVREVVRRLDDSSKQNAALVCRAWAREARAISPYPDLSQPCWHEPLNTSATCTHPTS